MDAARSPQKSAPGGRGAARCLWILALAPLALTPLLETPAAPGDPLAELARDLRNDRPETRRRAVRALTGVGTREAWLLLIGALEDGDSRVADEAELRLAQLAEPGLTAQLFGRLGLESRREAVRLRVAEAFGRFEVELQADLLARKISGREPELARMLFWSAERLASSGKLAGSRDGLIAAARSILRSRYAPALRASALLALAALDPTGVRAAADAAALERAPELRCAALLALQRAAPSEVGRWARKLAADAEPSVRQQALETLEALADRPSLEVLVQRLELEERERLRWRAVEILQRLSGFKHRLDPRPWRDWVAQLPPDWTPLIGSVGAGGPAREVPQTVSRGLIGLELISDRIAFLFDFSGSMWMPMADGRTPKQIVDEKLRQALESLSEDVEFNIVPFTNEPLPWEKKLVPSKRANVKRALQFFSDCKAVGKGNVYDAALLAMADPAVDTIVVLTDGVPTGGLHAHMDLVAPLLLERNRFRKVVFDTILVDAPGGAKRRWEAFSAATGGRCVEVALR